MGLVELLLWTVACFRLSWVSAVIYRVRVSVTYSGNDNISGVKLIVPLSTEVVAQY